ncbi:MAG: hypothetical protein R2827_12850 [Bdellovibrionales bacterium]
MKNIFGLIFLVFLTGCDGLPLDGHIGQTSVTSDPVAPDEVTGLNLKIDGFYSIGQTPPLEFVQDPNALYTEVQIHRSEDDAILRAWETATSPYQANITLERGKKIYFKLRSYSSSATVGSDRR